jgi:hydrophobic/amphiphilic exporter-1 (mainly G- bacteria), HAE1 family
MRQALGQAVFWGMLGVTFFGIFLTPVFFYTIRRRYQAPTPATQEKPAPPDLNGTAWLASDPVRD